MTSIDDASDQTTMDIGCVILTLGNRPSDLARAAMRPGRDRYRRSRLGW